MATKLDLQQYRVHGLPPTAYYIPNFITEHEEEYLLQKISESPQPKWKTVGTGRRLQYWGGTLSKNNVLIPETLPPYFTTFPDLIKRISDITDAFRATTELSEDNEEGMQPNQVLVNEYKPGQGISPHEDGPAYHPAVATVSLGSAAVVSIYQYLSHTDPSPPLTTSPSNPTTGTNDTTQSNGSGAPQDSSTTSATQREAKPIAAMPMASVYLEPRSLWIMTQSLYSTHLHGISESNEDILVSRKEGIDTGERSDGKGEVVVANEELLGDSAVREALTKDGLYRHARETRTSLTFRKVNKVMKAKLPFGLGGKR